MSHGSIAQVIKVGSENQSTFPAATEHKGSTKAAMGLDYLDGPTVIAEVCQLLRVCTSTASEGCCSPPSHIRQKLPLRIRVLKYVGVNHHHYGTNVF